MHPTEIKKREVENDDTHMDLWEFFEKLIRMLKDWNAYERRDVDDEDELEIESVQFSTFSLCYAGKLWKSFTIIPSGMVEWWRQSLFQLANLNTGTEKNQ